MTTRYDALPKPGPDYDRLAAAYDSPDNDRPIDGHAAHHLRAHASDGQAIAVLDLGCGTGKHLAAVHATFPQAQLTGLDASAGMLAVARQRLPQATWVQADATQRLPFDDGAFDVATCQFADQHLPDRAALIAEVRRVLRPGGRFALVNMDPWHMMRWHVYQLFQDALLLDTAAYTPAEQWALMLRQAGFTEVEVSRDVEEGSLTVTDLSAFVEARDRCLTLISLSDEDYEAGRSRIQGALAQGMGDRLVATEVCTVSIAGTAPQA